MRPASAVNWRNALPHFPPCPGLLQRASGVAAGAAIVLSAAACSPAGSIESADVPAWKATALPSAEGTVFEDAGKILNRDPIVKTAPGFGPGTYILTITCDGGGKAFFDVALDGARLTEAGAASTAAGRRHASGPRRRQLRSARRVLMPR